ncbi:MAG: CotH kinase family protein [Acidobacteriota bacterium]
MGSAMRHLADLLSRRPWLRGGFWTGLLAGGILVGWVLVAAARSWLFYRAIDRQPYRTSHLRIGAKEVVSRLLEPFYDRRQVADGHLPVYDLELSPGRLETWHNILRRVYARGYATADDQVWLPARFRHRDFQVEVDLRGRGTLFTHYKVRKPSFRVKFPKDDYFRGYRISNLIIPYDQARISGDTTLNAIARHYDLLTYPTRFVTLRLNGDVLGVYQEVEHWRKDLAVKQKRSEGYFMNSLGEMKGGAAPDATPRLAMAREAVRRCVMEACPPEAARELLDRFVDGEKMAAYVALTGLFGASHGWGEDNLMLFFDPPRGRFEPIPWDMGALPLRADPDAPGGGLEVVKGIGDALLRLDDFRARRNQLLFDMVRRKEAYALAESERLYEDLRPSLDVDIEHSRRYTRRIVDFFQRAARTNFALWRDQLSRRELVVEPTADGFRIENRAATAVWVEALHVVGAGGAERRLPVDVEVPGTYKEQVGEVLLEAGLLWPDVNLPALDSVRVEGRHVLDGGALTAADVTWLPSAEPKATADPAGELSDGGGLPALPEGVTLDDDGRYRFAGPVHLAEDLALPDGAPVRFEPGLRLSMGEGVSLVIRGDLLSLGSEDRPIWIGAADPERPFGVLAVLGRSSRPAAVILEHTTVQGGTEATYGSATFTGMLSIYDGSLQMARSRILDVRGEDGLNVKFGRVEVLDSIFRVTHSDAVDLDFCRGVMAGNRIEGAGGDSLDFSGSLIHASGNTLLDTADKGLSIGEDTTVLATGNLIRGARTGVAVKDSSLARVVGSKGDRVDIGVAVYRKKQTFDSGSAQVEGAAGVAASTPLLLDPDARLHLEAPSPDSP